ncbi:putative kinase [Frondihabitans sp. PhB188]|uniref:AAA family ATPase n=1 Tax=Frondihabitans sp. PhB188 TaxID=2485200 RepID=UPI000F48504C|nr:AAA family ATPase [Frondihabitans sp. PhB188]ROQ38776.1 putative kinase [Frondihabitans sp. PhB188]
MASFVVLVNGVPGAGKTTLSAELGRVLAVPVVSKDAVKEALADAVDAVLPTSPLGAVASDAMWSIAALIDGAVVIESFWFTGRDDAFLAAGLRTAGAIRGVEVWCEAPVDVMRMRFRTRARHAAHDDAARTAEWEVFAQAAAPLSGFPVVRVATDGPVDVAALAAAIDSVRGRRDG